MIIISWDVGIIHLAYCVLEYDINNISDIEKNNNVNIIDWDVLNLIENDRIEFKCMGKIKKKKNQEQKKCDKKASYQISVGSKSFNFCKTHLLQSNEYWNKKITGN